MGVLCDHAIKELIDNGLIDFNRSGITYESVITQVNPNTLDLSLGRFVRWPKEHSGQVIFGKTHPRMISGNCRKLIRRKEFCLNPAIYFSGSSREFLRMPVIFAVRSIRNQVWVDFL